jgi:type III secretion protein L
MRVIPGEVFDARGEAESIREAARREGREEGLAQVTALLVEARSAAARREAAAETDLRSLAVRIAEKLIARQLQLAPDTVADVVRATLSQARERRRIVVRVSPLDESLVRERLGAQVDLRPDTTVARGGCLVETEVGLIDARLDTQLATLERALRDG